MSVLQLFPQCLPRRSTSLSARALRQYTFHRFVHSTRVACDRSFTNLLADDNPPPVQVRSVTDTGVLLSDGLFLLGPCIFLDGKVFLWDPPKTLWSGWGTEHFELFSHVPKPEILLLGTGKAISPLPAVLGAYLSSLGIQLDVSDTRHACATYNILAEEGRRDDGAVTDVHYGKSAADMTNDRNMARLSRVAGSYVYALMFSAGIFNPRLGNRLEDGRRFVYVI